MPVGKVADLPVSEPKDLDYAVTVRDGYLETKTTKAVWALKHQDGTVRSFLLSVRIHGEGTKVGPDLSFVGDRRPDRDWHLRHFSDPQAVSPGSIMPKFPLSDQDKYNLASYMLSLKNG